MKILITGSHFTPAQAVIEKLLEIPDIKIVYLGRKYARDNDKALSSESKILPGLGIKFIPITAGKLNRFFSLQTIISLLKTPLGFLQSFYYLMKEQPDLIVSFGGFTGLPVVVCGWFLSIPALVHEQGLKMGLANLISSFFAEKIAVSFSDFKIPVFLNADKFIVTGNPIRKEFMILQAHPGKQIEDFTKTKTVKPLILITAGSQGSHRINLLVEDKLTELTNLARIVHQTGDSKFDDFTNLKKNESDSYLVTKWISPADLSYLLERSDLAVTRAGMNTLMELALKSVPALIIPIPVGNEQKNSAKYFSIHGLGKALEEKNLSPEKFLAEIREMLNKKKSLKKSAISFKEEIILDGDNRLVQEILLVLHRLQNPGLSFK